MLFRSNGYPDGTVKGNNEVSYQESVVMILRALGYNDAAVNKGVDKYNATAYKTKASSLGILKNVVLVNSGANRGDVAVMIYNALDVALVTVDADGKVTEIKDKEEIVVLLDRLATKGTLTVTPAVVADEKLVDLSSYLGETDRKSVV